MGSALRAGLQLAFHRLPLALVLWLVNLAFGTLFAALAAMALSLSLDGSWFTRSLLYQLDFNALAAAIAHSGAVFQLLAGAGLALAAIYVIGWLPLHAVIVAAVCTREKVTVHGAVQAGTRHLPVFIRLFVLSGAITGGLLFAIVVASRAVLQLARDAAAERAWEAGLAGGIIALAMVLVFCIAVHDHARIRAVAHGSGAWSSYAWALRFVVDGGRRAFLLALGLQVLGIGLWGVYQAATWAIPTNWMTGVIVALVWAQLCIAARMLLRVWSFAAQADLQLDLRAEEASLVARARAFRATA